MYSGSIIFAKSRELFWTSLLAVVSTVVADTCSCFVVADDTHLAVGVFLILTHILKNYTRSY